MGHFISYFDYLGYKEFILNNETEYLKVRVGHLLRDIELSLGQGELRYSDDGSRFFADLSHSKLKCLNISDTVIFWTQDDSKESFEEILKVSHEFNWREILYNFPIRGVMIYSDVQMITGSLKNDVGGDYNVNMIYGKGLVNAHLKAEQLNWAGSVIDNSVIEKIIEFGNIDDLLSPYAKKYNVPYKNQISQEEYAFKLITGTLNQEGYKNYSQGVIDCFGSDNKDATKPRVKELLGNTLEYLKTFKE